MVPGPTSPKPTSPASGSERIVDDLARCLRRLLDDERLRNDPAHAPKAVPTASEVTEGLLALYRRVPGPTRATSLLGREVELAIAAGWSKHAGGVLEYVTAVHGDIGLETARGHRRASVWLAELVASTRAGRPMVGEGRGQAIRIPGALVQR